MKRSIISYIAIVLFFLSTADQVAAQGRKKRKKIDNVITYARGYIGTPYQYGGTSKRGIDCSGLIQKSYATIGIDLPRTAKDQAKIGNKKGEGRVRPGDIVYFKFKQKREKWWHTGMVTYADDTTIKFVHASTSRGVVEDVYNDYYEKNTKYFRRVIK
ncbi:MAG: C40 family peptidase [Cyclobacteriaceae bacterium]